jgi:hypothetical protein
MRTAVSEMDVKGRTYWTSTPSKTAQSASYQFEPRTNQSVAHDRKYGHPASVRCVR